MSFLRFCFYLAPTNYRANLTVEAAHISPAVQSPYAEPLPLYLALTHKPIVPLPQINPGPGTREPGTALDSLSLPGLLKLANPEWFPLVLPSMETPVKALPVPPHSSPASGPALALCLVALPGVVCLSFLEEL